MLATLNFVFLYLKQLFTVKYFWNIQNFSLTSGLLSFWLNLIKTAHGNGLFHRVNGSSPCVKTSTSRPTWLQCLWHGYVLSTSVWLVASGTSHSSYLPFIFLSSEVSSLLARSLEVAKRELQCWGVHWFLRLLILLLC